MDNEILINANKLIKKNRPKINADEICATFKYDDMLEIGFLSKQCRNDAIGKCIMCDYGCADGTRESSVYLNELTKVLDNTNANHIIICSNGSFMDESQINHKLYCDILHTVNRYDFPRLEIETHYLTVTRKKLDAIKNIVSNKEIYIELGLETINQTLQDNVIMKDINLKKFKDTIDLIHSYNFKIDINVMLGMPFLSAKEQLKDALDTAKWVFENDCSLVIFPINIKPFTLLKTMYSYKFYEPISHWLMIEFLNNIATNHLNFITVAWFGNREEVYEGTNEKVVFPTCCENCKKDLMKFYDNFNYCRTSEGRRKLLDNLIFNRTCNCYENLINNLQIESQTTFKDKYEKFTIFLNNNF